MAESWKKVGDIFKTEGTVTEVGEFIAASGNKIEITNNDLDRLIRNIKGSIPFAIGHDDESNVIGYATEFLKTDNTIEHKGIISDSKSFEELVINGNYKNISPEIDYIRENGRIVDKKITKLCFVPNPAMPNTHTEITRFKFSAPEVTMTDSPKTESKEVTNEPETQGKTETPKVPEFDMVKLTEAITTGITKKFEEQINTLKSEIETLKGDPGKDFFNNKPKKSRGKQMKSETSQVDESGDEESETTTLAEAKEVQPVGKEVFDAYAKSQLTIQEKEKELKIEKERVEALFKSQYDNIINELKNFDVDIEPVEMMVKNLGIEDKISTLNAYKSQFVKNLPMNSPPNKNIGQEGGQRQTNEPTVADICSSYGDTYNPYVKQIAERLKMKSGV